MKTEFTAQIGSICKIMKLTISNSDLYCNSLHLGRQYEKFISITLMIFLVTGVSVFAGGAGEKRTCRKETATFLFVPGWQTRSTTRWKEECRQRQRNSVLNCGCCRIPQGLVRKSRSRFSKQQLQRRIDLVMMPPTSTDAIAPLKKIYDSGIELITVDTYLGDGDYSKPSNYNFPLSYIGSDNELGGKMIAEAMAKMVGNKGKVYINTTNPDVSSVVGRVNGFSEGIKAFPNMKLIGVDYNLDVQQKAQEQTLAALKANPDIAGVFGTNVYSAQGSYQAVVNAGLTGAVKIASWDATEELIAALKKGQVDIVLAQKPAEIGSLAVEWGYKFFTQKAEVPKKVIPGFAVFTPENVNNPDMQQFIYK